MSTYISDTTGLDTYGPPSEAYVQYRRERQETSKKNQHDRCYEENQSDRNIGGFGGGYFGERDIKEGFSEEEKFKMNEGKCADTKKRGVGVGPHMHPEEGRSEWPWRNWKSHVAGEWRVTGGVGRGRQRWAGACSCRDSRHHSEFDFRV